MGNLYRLFFIFFIVLYSYGDDFSKPISKDLFDINSMWGSLVVSYKTEELGEFSFKDKENNEFSFATTFGKYFQYDSFGFGFEVAGWSDFGLNIAAEPRVDDIIAPNVSQVWHDMSDAEISQLFFMYQQENIALMIGREEISRNISPWLFSDRSITVLDFAYDGLLISYKDTTNMYNFGWIVNISNNSHTLHLGEKGLGLFFVSSKMKLSQKFKLNSALYFFPHSQYKFDNYIFGTNENLYSIWIDGIYRFHNFANAFQIAYSDGDDAKSTIALANQIRVFRKQYMFKMTLSYINDGDYSLKTAGFGFGSSAFWGKSLNGEFGADTVGYKQYIARVEGRYNLSHGNIYGGVAYDNYKGEKPWHLDMAYAFQLGYILNYDHIKYKLEYRFKHTEKLNDIILDKRHIHFDIIYKFVK